MELLSGFQFLGGETMTDMLHSSDETKVSQVLVNMCVGYITLLIITAAILWYVIHMYQRGYADAIAEELYRKTFDLNPNLEMYRRNSGGGLPRPPARRHHNHAPIVGKIGTSRRSAKSQTGENLLVDALFRRMEQYRLSDKNIDKFLAGPNNRSILCVNTSDYIKKF